MTHPDGTLTVLDEIAVISFERRLRHPVEAVWAALTESNQLSAWLGPGTLERRDGGQVALRMGPEDRPDLQRTISGRILVWDPPNVLEHEWSQAGIDVSIVRYELEAAPDGTVLRFTHRRSVTPGAIGGLAGWHAYLDRLAAHLDRLPVPAWSVRRAEVQDAYGEAPLGQ